MFGLPISTLRYYDKEGLFLDLQRASGIRRFGEKEIDTLRMIECLKKSGLEIRALERTLDMLRFKCWYYEQAFQDGNEERIHAMLPDKLPEEIQVLYDHAREVPE